MRSAGRRRASCCARGPVAYPRQLGHPWTLGVLRASQRCCRSSVVEHSLGKGEVVCSIHTGSTRSSPRLATAKAPPRPKAADRPTRSQLLVRPARLGGVKIGRLASRAAAHLPAVEEKAHRQEGRRSRDALNSRCGRMAVRRSLQPALWPCHCRSQSRAASAARVRCERGRRARDRP